MSNLLKIRSLLFVILLIGGVFPIKSNGQSIDDPTGYENIFKDLKLSLSKDNGKLWNYQLYGPLMLIDRESRLIIANEADEKGFLQKHGNVFAGFLPNEFIIANTSFEWNNKRWTMVALPLPDDYNEHLSLLTHELFHSIQPEIGFAHLNEKSCEHLDKLEGRIYLKLELEALKKSLSEENESVQKNHIQNALLFRVYRHQLFPDAKESENPQELLEGLAEYTGSIFSGRDDKQLRLHYIKAIESLYENPTFVRSFAYRTTPVYGYFMQKTDESWNLSISKETNLTDFTLEFFNATLPENLIESIEKIKNAYDFIEINEFEVKRDQKQKEFIAELDEIFLKNSTLIIPLLTFRTSRNTYKHSKSELKKVA